MTDETNKVASPSPNRTPRHQSRTYNKGLSFSQELQFLRDIRASGVPVSEIKLQDLVDVKPDLYGSSSRSQLRRKYEHRLRYYKHDITLDAFNALALDFENQAINPASASLSAHTPSTPATAKPKKVAATSTPKQKPPTPKLKPPTTTPKPKTPTTKTSQSTSTSKKTENRFSPSIKLPTNAFTMASRKSKNKKTESDDEEDMEIGTCLL